MKTKTQLKDRNQSEFRNATYNFQPGNPGELLDDVEAVQDEQDSCEPEANHGHCVEPSSSAVTAECRHCHANKSQEIQHLKKKDEESHRDYRSL